MDLPNGESRRLVLDDLEVDVATREVFRDDERIELPRLSYRLLIALAQAAPAVLSHDELVRQVWDGRVVSPETVTQRVKLLRASLGDDASDPRYVALVRGEGYRMIPVPRATDALEPADDRAPTSARLRWIAVPAILAVAAVAIFALLQAGTEDLPADGSAGLPTTPDSVAVLPFSTADDAGIDEYVRDGIASRIANRLTGLEPVNVKAFSSSRRFRDSELDPVDIAARLGVEKLVTGSVEIRGNDLALTAVLIDGRTGFQLWAHELPGSRSDLPLLRRELGTLLAQQLAPESEPRNVAEDLLDWTTDDLLMLAESRYLDVRDEPLVDFAKLDEAIGYFRQVTRLEPDLAAAHAGLAAALLYRGDPESVESAESVIARALDIDPDSAPAWYSRGLYLWLNYLDGSGAAFARALELDANYADAHEGYAKHLWHQLDSAAPERHFERALEFDPQRLTRYADLANYYAMSGRAEPAVRAARRIEERFGSADAYRRAGAFLAIARTYELIGELDVAIAWAKRAMEADSRRDDSAWMVAELYARIGDFDTASTYDPGPSLNLLNWQGDYESVIELGDDLMIDQPEQPQIPYAVARAHAALGEHDLAVDLLRQRGIPGRGLSEARRARDEEALISLADSLYELGRVDEAQALVTEFRPFLLRTIATDGDETWWPHYYLACVDSILDERAAALAGLDRMAGTNGLPWYPLLKDGPCFRRLAGEAPYEAALARVERQRRDLLENVPTTLARLEAEWAEVSAPESDLRTNASMQR